MRGIACLVSFACLASGAPSRRRQIEDNAGRIAEFAGQSVAEATPAVMGQADKIASGTVFFYGHQPVEIGLKGIDWSGGHIRHQEWPAQLNRFFHLHQLASAYKATRNERYARAARSYIEDWLAGDNYAAASSMRPGDNTLTMSIRLGSSVQPGWGGTLPVFLASPSFDDAFLERILASIARQSRFLSGHLTPRGNWRIAELDAQVFTALRFPFLQDAPELLRTGIAGMSNALATQFLPDGVHIERTPGYHDWMTNVAANYYRLGKMFPDLGVTVDAARLARSLDYCAQSEMFGVNDSGAPQRDPEPLQRLRARAETLQRLGLAGNGQPPLDQVFADAGQVFSRTAWKPGADYLAFDASTWGGGHSHLSRLSFVFRSGGRVMLADPGILTYEMSDPRGPYGKSTAAHSTLNIGGWNQSESDARLLHTQFDGNAALIHARYQGGYWPGPYTWSFARGRGTGAYGDHERIVFWVKGEYLLVADGMTADPGADVRAVWQFGPMEGWSHDTARFAWWSRNSAANLWLTLIRAEENTAMSCGEGQKEPLRGWVGLRGHDAAPAPMAEFRFAAPPSGRASTVTLLVPFQGSVPPAPRVRAQYDTARSSIRHLELETPGGEVDHFAWSSGLSLPIDDGKPFFSDATFVWRRTGKAEKRFLLNGTYLRVY